MRELPQCGEYVEAIEKLPVEKQNFFILYERETRQLSEFKEKESPYYIYCFADPSEYEQPAWLMRNYVAFLLQLW